MGWNEVSNGQWTWWERWFRLRDSLVRRFDHECHAHVNLGPCVPCCASLHSFQALHWICIDLPTCYHMHVPSARVIPNLGRQKSSQVTSGIMMMSSKCRQDVWTAVHCVLKLQYKRVRLPLFIQLSLGYSIGRYSAQISSDRATVTFATRLNASLTGICALCLFLRLTDMSTVWKHTSKSVLNFSFLMVLP